MAAKSDILFIGLCANNKAMDGEPYATFDTSRSITNQIDPTKKRQLLASRREVLKLIQTNPEANLGGIPVSALPLGKGLAAGPEFDSEVSAAQGQYLPAIQRYSGRFYLGMGADRLQRVQSSQHHLLIISGLYGLVTPEEPIQSYSCHVGYHTKIPAVWQSHDLLSQLIADYIKRHNISTVLDLTADDDYRKLVAWEVVRHATTGRLLQGFRNMFAGADALISFGTLLNQLLDEPAKKLRDWKSHQKIAVAGSEVTFVDYPDPPSTAATIRSTAKVQAVSEQDVRVTYSDRIGRMRRNILKATGDVLMLGPRDYLDFMPRVQRIIEDKRNFQAYRDRLDHFNKMRNDVEYRRATIKDDSQMEKLMTDYNEVMRWFQLNYKGYVDYTSLEPLE